MVVRATVRRRLLVAGSGAAVWIAVTLIAVAAISPLETPPCPPFSYSVSYASPFCNLTLLPRSTRVPFVDLWWVASWNATPGSPPDYQRASDHLNVAATAESQVAIQDRDGDRDLSVGDIIEVWGLGGCGGMLFLYMGPNVTSLGGAMSLWIQAGYSSACPPSAPAYGLAVAIGAVFAAVVAVLVAAFLRFARRPPTP